MYNTNGRKRFFLGLFREFKTLTVLSISGLDISGLNISGLEYLASVYLASGNF